jgi:CDP-diglyceride synthetase
MKKRIIAAAVLVPILLLVLYALPKVVAAVAVSLICGVGTYELLYRTGLVRHLRLVIYSVAFRLPCRCWISLA